MRSRTDDQNNQYYAGTREDAADHKDDPEYLLGLETDQTLALKSSIRKVFDDLEFTRGRGSGADRPLLNKWLETSRCCMLAAFSGEVKPLCSMPYLES